MHETTTTPFALQRLPKPARHPVGRHADLVAAAATRTAGNTLRAAQLASVADDPEIWSELWQMQLSFFDQTGRIGRSWLAGLCAWSEQVAQIRSANTLGKLLEQDGNAVNQLGALVNQHVTEFITLVEGVQVGFGYWVELKLAGRLGEGSETTGSPALLPAPAADAAARLAPLVTETDPAALSPVEESASESSEQPAEDAPKAGVATSANTAPAPVASPVAAEPAKDSPSPAETATASATPALAEAAREVAAKYRTRAKRDRGGAGPSAD